jgi:hypothetical protein
MPNDVQSNERNEPRSAFNQRKNEVEERQAASSRTSATDPTAGPVCRRRCGERCRVCAGFTSTVFTLRLRTLPSSFTRHASRHKTQRKPCHDPTPTGPMKHDRMCCTHCKTCNGRDRDTDTLQYCPQDLAPTPHTKHAMQMRSTPHRLCDAPQCHSDLKVTPVLVLLFALLVRVDDSWHRG